MNNSKRPGNIPHYFISARAYFIMQLTKQPLTVLFANGFGLGHAKFAPGTVGTVLGWPLFWLLQSTPASFQLIACVFLIVSACFFSQRASNYYGTKDPKQVVIDEYAAFAALLLLLNYFDLLASVWAHLLAFLLFRLFDITKPYPVRLAEKIPPKGVGIVADDVVAAIYAGAFFWVIVLLGASL